MNSNLWQNFKWKFFKSGNPAMTYIGINICVFVAFAVVSIICFFAGSAGLMDEITRQFLAFPADLSAVPLRFYTLASYAFIHADVFHILFNMLWLFWMGQIFIDFLKPRQFHIVYWGSAIAGALFFALIYNLVPYFQPSVPVATLVGASAAVMGIFTAVVTLVPDYSIRLLLFGEVKLKWLLLIYIFLDLLTTANASSNAGGSLSHLGGALFGFIFIKLLQNGTDLSKVFERKPKLKVVKNEPRKQAKKQTSAPNQEQIDAILDKISKTGYDKLTADEKRILFDASNN